MQQQDTIWAKCRRTEELIEGVIVGKEGKDLTILRSDGKRVFTFSTDAWDVGHISLAMSDPTQLRTIQGIWHLNTATDPREPLELPDVAIDDIVWSDTLPIVSLHTVTASPIPEAQGRSLFDGKMGPVDAVACSFSVEDMVRVAMSIRTKHTAPTAPNSPLWWWRGTMETHRPLSRGTLTESGASLTTLGAALSQALSDDTGAVVTTDGGGALAVSLIFTTTNTFRVADDPYIMVPRSMTDIVARDVMATPDDVRVRALFEMAVDCGCLATLLRDSPTFRDACCTTSSSVVRMCSSDETQTPAIVVANGWHRATDILTQFCARCL